MAILNGEQRKALDTLTVSKRKYDDADEDLNAALRMRRDDNKQKVREAVAGAVEAGVPMRQIHLGMGFAQVNQLTNFLAPPKAPKSRDNILSLAQGLGGAVNLEPVEREQKLPAVRNVGNNGLAWMEDGVECSVIWRQYTPDMGYVSPFNYGKLSELGKKIVHAERTYRCLFTEEERDGFLKESIVPERFNN